ncbi:hypothetical protein LguiB_020920 [Lonicera macranthoides]
MDEPDLESMMSAVSLTEEEKDVTVVGDALLCNNKGLEALVLIGKVILSKQVSKEGLRAAMRKAWGRDFLLPRWVRLYNLPFLCRSREIVSIIGGKIGEAVDVDVGMNRDGLGKYIRVRVIIDISKLLKRGVKVGLANDTTLIWISVSYERLPDFCFECGRIDHSFKDCSVFLNFSIKNRDGK